MATKRLTSGQRKAQAAAASENIRREAALLMVTDGISFNEAVKRVFEDGALMAKCHDVGPIEAQPTK